MEELGLAEPKTMDEGMEIIRQFVEHDMAGGHKTIGIACSTEMISESSSTYGVDPIFIEMGSMPGKWILQDDGSVVYGSVTSQTKRCWHIYMNYMKMESLTLGFFLERQKIWIK